MNILTLTKQLVAIPSYVDAWTNEVKIADFLYSYLSRFSWMQIQKQYVTDKRYNLILFDSYPTRLLITGHIDTVQPRNGWQTNLFKATLVGNKLYGLGTTDMKGNLAAFLSALEQFKNTKGLMILLYVDEEYDFLGMKKFINEYKKKIKPAYIMSLDGKQLALGNGCRGLIEISCITQGKTGHASRPARGKNAITKSVKAINKLTRKLSLYANTELGVSTCNLAYIYGGLDLRSKKQEPLLIGKEGNNIANVAEFVLDIRIAQSDLDARIIIGLLRSFLEQEELLLESYSIRHDFAPWITHKKDLLSIEKNLTSIRYMNPNTLGFIDMQLLWEVFHKTPCFLLGAGNITAHKENEYVDIQELYKVTRYYSRIIQTMVGGEKND